MSANIVPKDGSRMIEATRQPDAAGLRVRVGVACTAGEGEFGAGQGKRMCGGLGADEHRRLGSRVAGRLV